MSESGGSGSLARVGQTGRSRSVVGCDGVRCRDKFRDSLITMRYGVGMVVARARARSRAIREFLARGAGRISIAVN